MKKDEKKVSKQHDQQIEYDIPHTNTGEKIFTSVMSVVVVGIIVFYASLPIRALIYDGDKSAPEKNDVVIADGEITPDTETSKPSEETPEVEVPEVQPPVEETPEEPVTPEEPTQPEEPVTPDEPTQPETPAVTPGKYAVIQYDNLNVRSDTTSNSDLVGQAPYGAEYQILETYTEYTWVKILFDGQEAYVHTDFIEIVER